MCGAAGRVPPGQIAGVAPRAGTWRLHVERVVGSGVIADVPTRRSTSGVTKCLLPLRFEPVDGVTQAFFERHRGFVPQHLARLKNVGL